LHGFLVIVTVTVTEQKHIVWRNKVDIYPGAQCAADTTHRSLMMLPPQKCPPAFCRDTCHGQLCGIASTPPTTRTLALGGIAGLPHPGTPGGTAIPSPSLTLGTSTTTEI